MSAETGSGIETVHVRLLDEAVDVWRPAEAIALGDNIYRLALQAVPDDETWEFAPGEEVVTGRRGSGTDTFVVALAHAKLSLLRQGA